MNTVYYEIWGVFVEVIPTGSKTEPESTSMGFYVRKTVENLDRS